jgi:hypothetical protein
METADGVLEPNTIVPDLELGFFGKAGFKGELYINGLAKNPNPCSDIDSEGNLRLDGQPFDCRNFGVFDRGWRQHKTVTDKITKKRTKVPLPTNDPASHGKAFNLAKFLEMKNTLKNEGVSLESGDVLVQQYSNFDINSPAKWDVNRASGYPYQKIRSRSCTMSYGTLFVLDAHPTEVCFRPPVFWPEENIKNRPIHPVSKLNATLPTGDDLVPHPISGTIPAYERVPTWVNDSTFRTFCYGFAIGGGINYSMFMPLLVGAKTPNITDQSVISAYGAYYQAPLYTRLSAIYSDKVSSPNRLEALKCIVQWGIDAFGSIKCFGQTAAGAGQKPAGTRSWSIIAGWFLGIPEMRMPETTMMQDQKRAAGWLSNSTPPTETGEEEENTPFSGNIYTIDAPSVPAINGKKMTALERYQMLYGDGNTLQGKKRRLALRTSQEGVTYFKVVDDPNNYIFHYDYMGKTKRRKFTGVGGIFTNTSLDEKVPLPKVPDANMTGNFAKMHWMNDLSPGLISSWYGAHDGKSGSLYYSYIKVNSGPGAGDTLYRIIHTWGSIRSANAGGKATDPVYSGYGFVLDRPWANGVPNETSEFEMMTAVKENVGDVFYVTSPSPHHPEIPDANLSPYTAYADICEPQVLRHYGWMNYIKIKTGTNADLDADSTFAHDYAHRCLYQTPYNQATYRTGFLHTSGMRQWEMAIVGRWYNRPWSNADIAKTMDWSKIPGAKTWMGVPVGDAGNTTGGDDTLVGDFDENGEIGPSDLTMLLAKWGQDAGYTEYDLNDDGVVDAADLNILQSNWGKKKKKG